MTATALPARPRSTQQVSLRKRANKLEMRAAVRLAADEIFRLTWRFTGHNAMWSETDRVWLGQKTYLQWALKDPAIDIPWIVAHCTDAPEKTKQCRVAVRDELLAYWQQKLKELPRRSTPRWMPLP